MLPAQPPPPTANDIAAEFAKEKPGLIRIMNLEDLSLSYGLNQKRLKVPIVIQISGYSKLGPLTLKNYLDYRNVNPNGWYGEHDIFFDELRNIFIISPAFNIEYGPDGGKWNDIYRVGVKSKKLKLWRFDTDLIIYPHSFPEREFKTHWNVDINLGKGVKVSGLVRHHHGTGYEGSKNVYGAEVNKQLGKKSSFKAWYRRFTDGTHNFRVGYQRIF